MSSFDESIKVILAHEGGWVNHPSDPGAETNFGISTLIIKRENITAEELGIAPNTMFKDGYLKPMKVDNAKALYKKLFWDRYKYGNIIDQAVATKVFDCAVNCGPGRSHKMAQKAVNACGGNVTVDGLLGPKTFAAINAIDPVVFVRAFANEMRSYYNSIVAVRPSLKVFIKNWTRRAGWGEK